MKKLFTMVALVLGLPCVAQRNPGSLVPTTPSQAPDYYCTWNLQGFVASHTFGRGSNDSRAEMNEDNLFGTHKVYQKDAIKNIDGVSYTVESRYQGWLDHFPSIRQDLLFVLDDTWDIPANSNSKRPYGTNYDNEYLGTLTIDPTRFPSFTGKDTERMASLVNAVKAKGWRGLGGWICAQNPINLTKKYAGKKNTLEDSKQWTVKQEEKYWKKRLKESQETGFHYWKVDWGNKDRDDVFRRNLSKWGREVAPDVIIEHASFQDGGPHKPYYISFSQVLRTYDVRAELSQAQTISRVAEVLSKGKAEQEGWSIINCEDEAYIAAGLGCAIGIMRHPYVGTYPDGKPDGVFDAGNRLMKNRLNEIVRAVRWHRIALPFSADGKYSLSDEMLFDSGKNSRYEAPARMSRRLPLPEILGVDAFNEERPYVLASLYDNECTSVAVINRLIEGDYKQHKVDVRVQPKRWDRKVGIFGHYHSLTLAYQNGLPKGKFKVFAQDLASDEAPQEIPYLKTDDGRGIIISGTTIEDLCKKNKYAYSEVAHIDADYTDLSDPGIVLLVVSERGNELLAQYPQEKRRAVFMGNSITDFWFNDWHGDLHPEFFTDNGYICRGIAGQRTDEMLKRFDDEVVALHPYVAVILAGVNDIGENGGVKYSEQVTLGNLTSMVNKAKEADIRPVVCSILPWGGASDVRKDQIESLNQQLRTYCLDNDIPFVDYYSSMVDDKRDLKQELRGNKGKDGLHPGKAGYQVMEALLKPVVEAEIAKVRH